MRCVQCQNFYKKISPYIGRNIFVNTSYPVKNIIDGYLVSSQVHHFRNELTSVSRNLSTMEPLQKYFFLLGGGGSVPRSKSVCNYPLVLISSTVSNLLNKDFAFFQQHNIVFLLGIKRMWIVKCTFK